LTALDEWMALRDASLAQARAELGAENAELVADAGYGQMDGLTMLHAPDAHPGIFFFRDGRLAVLRVEDPDVDGGELLARVGDEAPTLRSAAAKHALVHIRAEDGLAVADEGGRIRYIEIFPPTTFEDYRSRIYQPAPKFIE
jgi:hypothetical protein